MVDSCFVKRLLQHIDLTASEIADIAELEREPVTFAPGQKLWEEGHKADYICIVQDGWLMSETVLEGGERQILRFYFSGELIGTASIAYDHATTTVRAVDEAQLCMFPRARLGELFARHPRLSTLFYSLGMLEVIDLNDRLRAMGRTDGKARLAHLFLAIAERLRVLTGPESTKLHVPLTQNDLADAVGLTAIHVNRLLKEMSSEGLIRRHRRGLEVLDEPALRRIAQFRSRRQNIDLGWFPPAQN